MDERDRTSWKDVGGDFGYWNGIVIPCPVTFSQATEEIIIDYCKQNMAGFKRPKHVIFGELPKTSTGKIQKFELRKKVKELN